MRLVCFQERGGLQMAAGDVRILVSAPASDMATGRQRATLNPKPLTKPRHWT